MHWSTAKALNTIAQQRHAQLDVELDDALHRDTWPDLDTYVRAVGVTRRAPSTPGHPTRAGRRTVTGRFSIASEPQY